MKRKSIAMAMALAMVLSAAPVNMAGAAEDDILMEEIVVEEPMEIAEVPVETAGEETAAVEPEAAGMEEGEAAGTAEEEELAADGTAEEFSADESAISSGEVTEEALTGDSILESIEVVEEDNVDAVQMDAEGESTDEPKVLSDWGPVTVPAAVETETDLTPGVVTYQLPAVTERGSIVIEKREGVTATLVEQNGTVVGICPWSENSKGEDCYSVWSSVTDEFRSYSLKLENTTLQEQSCALKFVPDSHLDVPESDEYEVSYGESVRLSARSTQTEDGFGEIQYQWYQERDTTDDFVMIADATEPEYLVQAAQRSRYYKCVIKDDYTEQVRLFYVYVDTHLTVESDMSFDDRLYVESGQALKLSLNATSDLGAGAIRYQWIIDGENDIPGATGAAYQTPALTKGTVYTCEVTDGEQTRRVSFSIFVMNAAAEVLTGDVTVTASASEGHVALYKIVPARTGKYALYSTSDMDTYATLLDENKNMLTYDDDGDPAEDSMNFRVEYTLTAGKTYYLTAGFYYTDDSGSYQVTMAMTCAHTPARYVSRVEPTCAVNGSCVAVCASCGEEYEDVLPATGQHPYGDWSVAQAPTVFADGVQVRTCTVCGAQETAPIAKLAPTMTVNASSIPLKAGQSTTKIKVTDLAAGDSIVSWTSSNPKVVKVNAAGKITAQKKAGGKKATVTVTLASGLTGNITVKVQKSAVKTSKISVETKKLTLEKGAKYSVVPVIAPITTLDKVSYSSSNKKVATVSKKGVITAKKSGKAKITVKSGKKKVTITVTVPKTQPTGITNIPAAKTLKKGKSTTLKAKLAPASAEAKITYKSSNKKVATVNAKGKVTAKKKGTAVITVKAGSIVTTCTITVK